MQNSLSMDGLKKVMDLGLLGLCLAVLSLPWPIKINSICIILLVLIAIYSIDKKFLKERLKLENSSILILFFLYFFLHIVAITYSSNTLQGFKALEKKLAFLIIPVCVLILMKSRITRGVILKFFLLSILVATFVCLVISFKNNIDENLKNGLPIFSLNKWFYTYRLLSYNIGIHPAYLSFFASIGVVYLLTKTILKEKFRLNLECLALTYLLSFIVLLSSRNIMITCFGLVGFAFIYAIWKYRSWKLVGLAAVIFLTAITFLFLNDVALDRLSVVFESGNGGSNWGNLAIRLQEWEASLLLIKDHFWLGVSPSDVNGELIKVYQNKGWDQLAKESFNSHNQYLQTFLSLGVLGILTLLAIIFISFRKAFIKRDFIYTNFLILFCVFSISESTLEVQKGIVSFVLLSTIFYYSATLPETKND